MPLAAIIAFAGAALGAVFGAASFFRKSARLSNALFGAGMLALSVELLFLGLSFLHSHPVTLVTDHRNRLLAMSFLPAFWMAFAATYGRRTAPRVLAGQAKYLLPLLLLPPALAVTFYEDLAILAVSADDALEVNLQVTLGWAGFVAHLFLVLGCIGTVAGLERSYRASVGTLRWKIKFMFFGLVTLFGIRFLTSCQALIHGQIEPAINTVDAIAMLVASALIARAMLRNGSFEIDLYPSKAVLSNSFTIGIAGIYLIVVGVLAKIMQWLQGEGGFALKALVILMALVGLGLILQSDRFKQWVKRFVSQHFQRPLFDYQSVWMQVTEATSRSVDSHAICQAATALLTKLFDVKLANLWLADANGRLALTASASLTPAETSFTLPIDEPGLLSLLAKANDSIDLDEEPLGWTETIRRRNPSAFKRGGNRLCVPLIDQNEPVGFVVLGDRNNRSRFSQQELDTLRCIGAHLASSLLSAKLSSQRAQAKEIEAFQTMAAFFVHDLKNAVSTLNLMLRNMPQHWDNPEFREDALRGIGSASSRINQLVARLGQVRNELSPQMERLDLNKLAEEAIAQWERPERIHFQLISESAAPIEADPAKLRSVILNLLINATEAIPERGSIVLRIRRRGANVSLAVRDNGSGMSPEFLHTSLFRPFQTTKKGGLGIGMFQSKAIVEAHRGSIQVESAPDKGTTFTLCLPAAPDAEEADLPGENETNIPAAASDASFS